MNCTPEFVETTSRGMVRWKCVVCGRLSLSTAENFPHKARADCNGKPNAPRLLRKLANFTKAAISHAMSGAPTCSQEEIDERYSICRACEIYQPDKENPDVGVCTHSSCGCPVTRQDKFVSKLAWADQQCPLGKWPAIDAAEAEPPT